MPTLREYIDSIQAALADDPEFAGPPLLIGAADAADETLIHEAADAGPGLEVTRGLASIAEVVRTQGDRRATFLAVMELVSLDSPIHEVRKPESGSPIITVGRDEDNDIVLPSDTVSARHALIKAHLPRLALADDSSRNGTFVNKLRLEPDGPMPLTPGDCIRFGDEVFYYLAGKRLGAFFKQWLRG